MAEVRVGRDEVWQWFLAEPERGEYTLQVPEDTMRRWEHIRSEMDKMDDEIREAVAQSGFVRWWASTTHQTAHIFVRGASIGDASLCGVTIQAGNRESVHEHDRICSRCQAALDAGSF